MNEALRRALKPLRLSGMTQSLEVRLQEAAGNGLTHAEFLELVLQDELLVRKERQIKRRIKAAMFRELKTLEDFDWQFNPSIKKKQIFDLASCRFIHECRDCLFLGPPGTGKKSFWCKRLDIRPSRAVLLFDIAQSSMPYETSCTMKHLPARRTSWPNTLSPIC